MATYPSVDQRTVVVVVKDDANSLTMRDLFISFHIRKSANSTPSDSRIDIYNQSVSSASFIKERGIEVLVAAGYAEPVQLFKGDIRRVERIRQGVTTITRIICGGNIKGRTNSLFAWDYAEESSVREIVTAATQEIPDVILGDITVIPDGATIPEFVALNKPDRVIADALSRLDPPLIHYVEDGVLHVRRKTVDDTAKGAAASTALLSERTGMIGAPTVIDKGIKVKSVMNGLFQLNAKIRVESEYEGTGDYTIKGIEHVGANRHGPFHTELTLREPPRFSAASLGLE